MARWRMPGPPQFGGAPITNIRNVGSPDWRRWLGPATGASSRRPHFASTPTPSPARRRNGSRLIRIGHCSPSQAWTPWRGVRGPKSAPIEGEHELFGFLTTDANAVVAPIHPKAMPVTLTAPEEIDLWLAADATKARPLRDDMLRIVASGEKEDGAARPRLTAFRPDLIFSVAVGTGPR
jgi:putative SOS response-associated peptidase YedK